MSEKVLLNDVALVVMSCDAYEDVAEHFFVLKERFLPWWKSGCYYINETRQFKRDGVKTINAGKELNWNGRLKKALNEVTEKYILYMQEDYLIDRPVMEKDIIDAIKYMEKNKIWYYKIDNLPKINKMIDDVHSAIPSDKRYGINLLTAIIERKKFLELLPENDATAWEVESSFLKRVTNKYEYDLEGCVLNTKPIISVCYGVRQGKWMRSVIKHFKKIGYVITPKNRKTMSVVDEAKLNIIGFMSHKLTTKQVRTIKRFLMKMNFKFVSLDK